MATRIRKFLGCWRESSRVVRFLIVCSWWLVLASGFSFALAQEYTPDAPTPQLPPISDDLPFCPEVGARPEAPGVPGCIVPPGGLPPIDWESLPPCVYPEKFPEKGLRPWPGLPLDPVGTPATPNTPGVAIAMCRSVGISVPIPPGVSFSESGPVCTGLELLTPEDRERLKTICPER
jgi:hypothetical protein